MPPIRVLVATAALGLVLAMAFAGTALAGQYKVASCQADQLNHSTIAFNNNFVSRGMKIRSACNPEGNNGTVGLLTANVRTRGKVPRGALARVSIVAPPGTHFTTFKWGGDIYRTDCRYSLQLWADNGAGVNKASLRNYLGNHGCSNRRLAQAHGYETTTFDKVAGRTRIMQKVVCRGASGRPWCSARGRNYIVTYLAVVGIADDQPPAAAIAADTPLAVGSWVGGSQPLNYTAQDNVGVRSAMAFVAGQSGGSDDRPCAMAAPAAFADGVPCPNGPGHITVQTKGFPEGTQPLVVQAYDTAQNAGNSAPVTVRIDNTAPGRVDVGVERGDQWRNSNDFALTWTNPVEIDRAPIAAVTYKLCAAGTETCSQAAQTAPDIQRLPVQVPGPGRWTVSLWRQDAAGNADQAAESVPVTLRYDPEPPQVAFEPPTASDPTLVSAQVTDQVSGLADGVIEISQAGSNIWQTLSTQKDGSRLVARIDDVSLPAGSYVLRATAHDQAGNEASTTQRLDGQQMAVVLPLRITSVMRVGVARQRVKRRTVRRHGRRRIVQRRVTVVRPNAVVGLGRRVKINGWLTNRDGQGVAGADVQVLASSAVMPEQLVGVVQSDAMGRFSYTAAGTASRTLRFVYRGSPLMLPAQGQVAIVVPAATSLRVSRRRVLNGQSVMFRGRIESLPLPAGGKLIQLEVRLPGRWQTFRTARTDQTGRWAVRYRFTRTRGVQRYRFRAALPPEAGYPFGAGTSKSLRVRVRGQ
jgi:hypothetical protein